MKSQPTSAHASKAYRPPPKAGEQNPADWAQGVTVPKAVNLLPVQPTGVVRPALDTREPRAENLRRHFDDPAKQLEDDLRLEASGANLNAGNHKQHRGDLARLRKFAARVRAAIVELDGGDA